MVKIFLDELSASWNHILKSSRDEDLREMSAQVWNNTSRPLSQSLRRDTTARDFCTNVTGVDVRWEVIGLIVSLVALVAQSLKDGDPVFCSLDAAPVDRAELALSMHHASYMCVEFCDDIGVLNDLYLWLLYENCIVYCSLHSRGSYDNWRKTSAFVAALQCANLHQEIEVNDDTPLFMTEIRKRLLICAYSNDKLTAAFAGRPPRLTRFYCRLQLPLDLTDAQIMSEGPELETAIAKLDNEGWNRDDTVQRSTFARIAAANALITEEILEISLGCLPQEEVARRAVDIERRALTAWQDLPEFLRFDISDPWTPQRSPLELLFLIHIRLASLDHHFLLQRTLNKKAQVVSVNSLLSVCSDIFRVVVMMVDNRDFFRDFQIDFVQILCTHGIPVACILAIELLRQGQTSMSASSAEIFPLHRSDTIQSLSVFVACLGTIRPGANGYQSCERAKKFVKRVLDMILGPGPGVQGNTVGGATDPTLCTPLFEPGNDDDFTQWLDDVHWNQETWINFT
ncbi:hypothetical protein E8E12_000688 [Didymella heteroderae]|uniref:Xylanolytic transcriptional activator regulatory domain-containing protein n=1 Tax=Didymella heteroderae TaxID=1769908 RepID=A0A9P4WII1_9PLEO|nr:hypothetical protein E8E12_000688 [Didymella heteroderae]